jgi:serine protease Do
MRVARNERTDQRWAGLVGVGALILTGVVLLQGVVAASPAEGSRIGVSIEEVETSAAVGAPNEGAYVKDVHEGTPAADAGFEAGDVVVEFDGERVRSAIQLSRLVWETPPGREVSSTVMRDGMRETLAVTPEPAPGRMQGIELHRPDVGDRDHDWSAHLPNLDHTRRDLRMAIPHGPGGLYYWGEYFGKGPNRLGVEVTSISSQLAEYFGVEEGVLVATVESNSVASAAGLQAGDIITAINAEAVDGPSTLRRHVATLEPGEAFTIEVTRDSREVELDGQIEEVRPRRLHRQQEEAI